VQSSVVDGSEEDYHRVGEWRHSVLRLVFNQFAES